MADNNGLGEGLITIWEDSRSWMGLIQEVKAVEEEIRELVATSRRRLIRAADEEMRGMLRQTLARLSEMPGPELLTQAREARESPPLEAIQQDLPIVELEHPQTQETSPEPCGKLEAGFAEGLNDYQSSPKMDAVAEVVAPQGNTGGHNGTQNGVEAHEETPLAVAVKDSPPDSGETYSGTVQLVVAVEQSAIQALQFVDALCRHPSIRLQRLLGTAKGRIDIWVVLREPMNLKEALQGMEGVSHVDTIPAKGSQYAGVYLGVHLKEPAATHDS